MPRVPDMAPGRPMSHLRLWAVGAMILVLFAGWELVVAAAAHTRAAPAVGTLVVVATAVVFARLAGAWHLALPAGLTALAITVADVVSPTAFSGRPLAGPLGYGNADGILDALGVAASMLAALSVTRWWRIPWIVLGTWLTIVAYETKSVTGVALAGVLLLIGGVALVVPLSSRIMAGSAALAIFLVVAGTVLLGHEFRPHQSVQPRLDRIAAQAVTLNRIALWHDAVAITARHPWVGVGPQRFAVASPTARSDSDFRWAHSGWLQQGAEAGLPGAVLLAAAFAWALVLLGAARTSAAGLAAAAVGALGMHSGIDYVLHFAAVPAAAGALVGSGAASINPRRARSARDQPEIPG
jgi:O-antigen ligase